MSKKSQSFLFTLVAIMALSLCQQRAFAFVSGVKGMGMASAVTAHPIDAMVVAYNPAGLAFVGNRWDLGVNWAHEYGRADFTDNDFVDGSFDSHHSWDNLFTGEFSVTKYTCECQFTWGFSIFNRSFYKTTFKSANPILGTSKPGLEYMHYVAGPTGTLRFGHDHAIGVMIDFHGQRLKVDGLQDFATEEFSKDPERVTDNGYSYSGGIGVTVGWFSKVSDCVAIGVSYSPEVKMSRFSDYKGLVANKGRLEIPQRWTGGLTIEMLNDLFFAFDIEHLQYNHVGALRHGFVDEIGDHRLGGDKGPGLGWRDQTIFRFGIDWVIDERFSYRLGYSHQRSPVKSSETFPNSLVPNLTEDILTFGASWWCGPCNEFSFYLAYVFPNRTSGDDSIPDDFGGGDVNLKERKWMGGFSWGKRF